MKIFEKLFGKHVIKINNFREDDDYLVTVKDINGNIIYEITGKYINFDKSRLINDFVTIYTYNENGDRIVLYDCCGKDVFIEKKIVNVK